MHEHSHSSHSDASHATPTLPHVWRYLRPERTDVYAVILYSICVGLLNLAIPIAAQAMVSTVAFGTLLQPIVVLSLVLLGALGFQAVLTGLEAYTVEIIQRRIFLRGVSTLALRLPSVREGAWPEHVGEEQLNRAFDIFTIQKSLSALTIGALDVVLTVFLGMCVLAFYHPYLLGLDLALLLVGLVIFLPMGKRGGITAIEESAAKYRLVNWFETIAREQRTFRSLHGKKFAMERSNALAEEYLHNRDAHFRILFRQVLSLLTTQALTGAVVLGVGGILVVNRQLTLGQLVAAELIVFALMGALNKMGKYLETYYDLLAAINKAEHITELPVERPEGEKVDFDGPLAVRIAELGVGGEKVALQIPAGSRWCLTGDHPARTKILNLIAAQGEPEGAKAYFNEHNLNDVDLVSLREHIGYVDRTSVVGGTLSDNLRFGASNIDNQELRSVLHQVRAWPTPDTQPASLDTDVETLGFSADTEIACMVARAVLAKPKLLVVNGTLDGLPQTLCEPILDSLLDAQAPWTLVVHSQNEAVVSRFKNVIRAARTGISVERG